MQASSQSLISLVFVNSNYIDNYDIDYKRPTNVKEMKINTLTRRYY